MLRRVVLLLVLVASACGGNDETIETVTVTVTQPPATTTGTSTTPPRPPFPLPASGTLPVDAFNAYTEGIDEPWERDLAAITNAFVGAAAGDATQRSFQAMTSGEGSGSASASLTLDGLLDDSVQAQRFVLELSRREDGTWNVDSASWAQRCQAGRGHQSFSPELCR